MKTKLKLFGIFAALTLGESSNAFAQAPANDDFANRTVLTGSSITFAGSLAGATIEPGETNATYYWMAKSTSGSAWWTWTAPQSTTAVIWFSGPQSVRNYLAIFTGTSFGGLTPIYYVAPPAGRYFAFNVTAGTAYQFQVIGTDPLPFTVQLVATNLPVFVSQPKDAAVSPYGSAVFSAIASRPSGFSSPSSAYQWYFNGAPLPGQTYPSLLIHGVTTKQSGAYSVTASNLGGVTMSAPATLTVVQTNPVPNLAVLPPNGPNLQFSLTGEPGRWYQLEFSNDLLDWKYSGLPVWLRLTNSTTLVSIPRLSPTYFVRASLDVPTDVCVAQLEQMRWAAKIWMIETYQQELATISLSDIRRYVPVDSEDRPPFCPENGIYSSFWGVTNNPTCSLSFQGRGHFIPDAP